MKDTWKYSRDPQNHEGMAGKGLGRAMYAPTPGEGAEHAKLEILDVMFTEITQRLPSSQTRGAHCFLQVQQQLAMPVPHTMSPYILDPYLCRFRT